MKRIVVSAAAAMLVALAIVACQNTLSGSADPWDPTLGRLTVRIDNGVQATSTIAPDLAMAIDQYTITLGGPNGEEITATLSGGATSRSFFNLAPGTWVVTGEGREQVGETLVLIAEGDTEVDIEAGERATATLELTVLQGEGTLDLTVLWPNGFYVTPDVDATLTSREAEPVQTPLGFNVVLGDPIDGDHATYRNEAVPFGYYDLSIALLDDNEDIAWSRVVAVRIVANQESVGVFNLRASETTGALELTVQADLNNPYVVDFTVFASELSLAAEETMTVGVSLLPDPGAAPVEVRWYLNGQPAGSDPTIEIDPQALDLDPGTYWLDALVTVGTTLSSHGESFTVQ